MPKADTARCMPTGPTRAERIRRSAPNPAIALTGTTASNKAMSKTTEAATQGALGDLDRAFKLTAD